MKKYIALISLFIFLPTLIFASEIKIQGTVTNESNQALQYVSIGIVNKTIGTVSNKYGSFTLIINENQISDNDTLRFSMIGYESRSFSLSEIANQPDLNIQLPEKIVTIPEAIVTTERIKVKKKGTSYALFPLGVQFAISEITDQNLGSEIGRSFSIYPKNTQLENFRFYIMTNNYDTVIFRINVYSIKNGKPYKSLLTQNIYTEIIEKKTKWVDVDLKPFNIFICDDIIVSLEWVKKSDAGDTLILPLARPSVASHFYKYGSQNRWKKFRAMSTLMELTLKHQK